MIPPTVLLKKRVDCSTNWVRTIIRRFNDDGVPGGTAVTHAGQLLPQSPLGGVVVSRVVKDLVAGSGILFSDGRRLSIPGQPDFWELYEVIGC